MRASSWGGVDTPTQISGLALSPAGAPQAGVPMTITAFARNTYSTRKRMVGGFYSYDHHVQTRDLGVICQGSTAADGKLACSVQLQEPGSIQLVAAASDAQGNASRAEPTIWVKGGGSLWVGDTYEERKEHIQG